MSGKTNSLLALTAALLWLLFSDNVLAQAGQCGEQRKVTARALDELTWKQLNAIYEDVGEEKYDEAYEDLLKMVRRAGKNEYLQAVMYQALAQVEWSRKNYDESLGYFELAVGLDTLPDQAHFALMYQVAQLYSMKDRYQDSLEALDLWFCKVPADQVTSHAYVLKASINAQKQDYREVLKAIETAIDMEAEPKEDWYQLKLAAHYELEQYPEAAATLELMILRWPDKKSYWLQLAQVYYKLEQEDKSLAVMAMAYRKNLLDKQGDITYLSSLYSNANVPYKAAEVLEKGVRDGIVESSKSYWTMVAETWYGAEELQRSLVAFKEAGKAAEDGDIDLRRGYILVDLEDWQQALDALDEALRKGGLDDRQTGEAYLLRGMTHFNLENFDAASADWDKASRYESSRNSARQWINHLQPDHRDTGSG